MYDEEIGDVHRIPASRIREAVSEADEAFWAVIVRAFPR